MSKEKLKTSSVSSDSAPPTRSTSEELEKIVERVLATALDLFKKELANKFTELESQIQKVADNFEERIGDLERKYQQLETVTSAVNIDGSSTQTDAIQKQIQDIAVHANENEQYSRRNNIRIKGLSLKSNEDAQLAVHQFCKSELHCDINIDDIDVAHVVPTKSTDQKTAGPTTRSASQNVTQATPILVRFKSREARDKVIRCRRVLKGTKVAIQEDLTALNIQTLNRLQNSSDVRTSWTWNGKIFAVLKDNTKVIVRPYQSLHECTRI